MNLTLKNIGKIQDAVVEINGITVIAGANNTGKSTIGKTLYSVFNSFYNIEKQIRFERIQSIESLLDIMYRDTMNRLTSRVNTEEIAEEIVDHKDRYNQDSQNLKEEILNSIYQYDKNFEKHSENNSIEETIQRILDVLRVSDEDIFKTVLNKKLDVEFNGQISNIFSPNNGCIELQIKDQVVSIYVSANIVTQINNRVDLRTETVYLDDPFVLDEQRLFGFIRYSYYYLDHKSHLRTKLFSPQKDVNVINEIVTNNKFENIFNKINLICSGDIVRKGRSTWGYKKANTDKVFDIKNISTGLKTFIILKTLLANGTIEPNGTIILDEPEIHLHPEWQLLFAELIVLIQKEFGMHILINTHSPYFLNAIEVYSAKYEIANKCKYYLATILEENSYIKDVTENVELIYSKLARPLQDLENERYRYDQP